VGIVRRILALLSGRSAVRVRRAGIIAVYVFRAGCFGGFAYTDLLCKKENIRRDSRNRFFFKLYRDGAGFADEEIKDV
jgi:hypothetical protein